MGISAEGKSSVSRVFRLTVTHYFNHRCGFNFHMHHAGLRFTRGQTLFKAGSVQQVLLITVPRNDCQSS